MMTKTITVTIPVNNNDTGDEDDDDDMTTIALVTAADVPLITQPQLQVSQDTRRRSLVCRLLRLLTCEL